MRHSLTRVACLLFLGLAACHETRPPRPPVKEPAALRAVPFEDVRIEDGFWKPRLETNRRVTIEACLARCEETGRIANFARAGGREKGPHQGALYNDSDVFKVIEGIAYALALSPDAALERRADVLIDLIASAQQADGYLDTYCTLAKPGGRWKDIRSGHELYCAGHLIEAAVAYAKATGKRTLLDVAVRLADHIDRVFGPGRRQDPPGHPEIELALMKLARATGEGRYARLAAFFLDQRGRHEGRTSYGEYAQDHLPVREQAEVVGHAVRAMYLYCGMADVAAETHDEALLRALERLWHDVVDRKMYVTGGIGASAGNEGFARPYELPNDSAYCETCAAIGMALWGHRMFLLTGDARYADVMERELYNGALCGVSLSGDRFFYDNPLLSRGDHHRVPWFDCSCCPTNLVRFLPSLGERVYATRGDEVYVLLYIGGVAKARLGDDEVTLVQRTDYPWSGRVDLLVEPRAPREFTLKLRVPGWCEEPPSVRVNGRPVEARRDLGFLCITREWTMGDGVTLDLPMRPRCVHADPRVKADAGRFAWMRGPLVYCLEGCDHHGCARGLWLTPTPEGIQSICPPHLMGEQTESLAGVQGVVTMHQLQTYRMDAAVMVFARAVPYFLWDNREPGDMVVWIPESAALTESADEGAVAEQDGLRISASHCWRGDTLLALDDGALPRSSHDEEVPRMTFWDHKGGVEWVQYEFPSPRRVHAVEVYWFDDGDRGGCRAPASWRVLQRGGPGWIDVALADGSRYGTALDVMNRVEFAPIEAQNLRLEVRLREGFSAGILKWRVDPAR